MVYCGVLFMEFLPWMPWPMCTLLQFSLMSIPLWSFVFPSPPQSLGLAHEVMDFIKYAPYCYKLLYQFLFHSRGYLYCIFITIVFVEGKEFYIKVYSKLVRPRKLFLCPPLTVVCPYGYLAHTLKKFFFLPFEHTICEDCFTCNYITFILSVL